MDAVRRAAVHRDQPIGAVDVAVAIESDPRTSSRSATLSSRCAAYLLDWVVAFIVACLLLAIGGLQLLIASEMGRADPPDWSITAFFVIVSLTVPVWTLITIGGWLVSGRTVGKVAFNLRITDRQGARPAAWRLVLRFAVYVLEQGCLLVLGPALAALTWYSSRSGVARIGYAVIALQLVPLASLVSMIATRRRRALHDLIAGTRVVFD